MVGKTLAITKRDIALALGRGSSYGLPLTFFLTLVILFPFGMGPNPKQLAIAGPAILWAGPLLGVLLALERVLQSDAEDGTLTLYKMSDLPLELVIMAKALAVWLINALPLILAAPLFGLMLNMQFKLILGTLISLLIGTPALVLFGIMGAAITSSANKSSMLLAVLIIPLLIPTLIFGASAALGFADAALPFKAPALLLSACTLFSIALAPIAGAMALRLK